MATGHETCAAYQIVNCLNGMNSTRDAVLYYLEGRDVKENPLTGTFADQKELVDVATKGISTAKQAIDDFITIRDYVDFER